MRTLLVDWSVPALAASLAVNVVALLMLVVALKDNDKAWSLVRAWHAHHKLAQQKLARMYERGWRLPEHAIKTTKWVPPEV